MFLFCLESHYFPKMARLCDFTFPRTNDYKSLIWFFTSLSNKWIGCEVYEKESEVITLTRMIFSDGDDARYFSVYFPPAVKFHILKYWLDINTYSFKPAKLALLRQIQDRSQEDSTLYLLDMTGIYYPMCRGFCFVCGELARKNPSVPTSNTSHRARKLMNKALNFMRMCYPCAVMGYSYEENTKQIVAPNIRKGAIQPRAFRLLAIAHTSPDVWPALV